MREESNQAVLTVEEVFAFATEALQRAGADSHNADAVARTVQVAERDGCASHGLFRVPGYVAALKSGKINGAARVKISAPQGAVLKVDGDGGFAPPVHEAIADPLADLAKRQGIALGALTNLAHFSALWRETELLSERGCAAFACVSYMPMVAPAGGKDRLLGTNPISFSWPRPDGAMTFDQATASRAMGDVQIAAREGESLPLGVGIDAEGKDTTDPNEVVKGAILPFGGYKGSAVSIMVELLAGPLLGETLSFEASESDNKDGGPPLGGEFILAFAPEKTRVNQTRAGFGGTDGSSTSHTDHGERLFSRLLAMEGVRLPGDGRRARRPKVASNGVHIPKSLYDKIVSG